MFPSPYIVDRRAVDRRVRAANSEGGFVLLAVLFLVALILIGLAVAAPRVAKSIQRDKEEELVHRGEQYKRAIQLYYRKFGAYPTSIDQLENTNQIRFLRKRYTDPMTGKDDWKLIHFGQAHVPVMGLFGQPLSNGANPVTAGSSVLGGVGSGGVGSGSGALGTAGTAVGSSTTQSGGDDSQTGTAGTSGSTGLSSSTGSGLTGSGSGFGSGSGTGGLGTGNTNPTLGGGPIVGVAIPDTKASIKEYKQQKHYNEWEFVYDKLEDQLQAGTLFGGANQNLNGSGTGGITPTNVNSGFSGTGFPTLSTGGTGTSGTGTSGTNPTPQQ